MKQSNVCNNYVFGICLIQKFKFICDNTLIIFFYNNILFIIKIYFHDYILIIHNFYFEI